jgi:glycosyltransferase involved in cell wall biosynthesis
MMKNKLPSLIAKDSASAQSVIRVGLINTYLEGRESQIPLGEYPAHHLWGVDHLAADKFKFVIIPHSGDGLLSRAARSFSLLTRYRFGDLDQEWQIWKNRNKIDIAYVAHGNIFVLLLLHALGIYRPLIVRWKYTPIIKFPWWTLRELDLPLFNRGTDLMLCLTGRAEKSYKAHFPWLKVKQMDWGVDIQQFAPGARDGGFFFACGKTNRDYSQVLQAACDVPAPIHLVVHSAFLKGYQIPSNIHIAKGSSDGIDDRGISYPQLIENYYHRALAVLIPLKSIPDDTAGMTNLLEAMACGLPVIMTRTGAIELNVHRLGIGLYVDPDDTEGWASACNWILRNRQEARAMGDRGRELVETHYNSQRLATDLAEVFLKLTKQH